MLKLLKTPVIVILYICLVLTPFYITKWGNRLYLDGGVAGKIIDDKIDAEIAVFGSSVAWVHFNPEIIENKLGLSCFNFGTNGTSLTQYRGLLKEYLEYSSGHVIVLAGTYSEFDERAKISDVYKYSDYINNESIYESLSEVDPKLIWKLKYVPYYEVVTFNQYSYIRALKGLSGLSYGEEYNEVKGFSATDKNWENSMNSAMRADISSKNIDHYKEVIRQINESGKIAVLVLTPIYVEGQNQIQNLEEVREIYKTLAGTKNAFLDFSKSDICLDRSLFYNNSHLNSRGADTFTKEFSFQLGEILDKEL